MAFLDSLKKSLQNWAQKNPQAANQVLKLEKPVQKVSSFLQQPYKPVSIPTAKTQYPGINIGYNYLVKPIIESTINAPTRYIGGITKTGLSLGRKARGENVSIKEILGNIGQTGQGILDAAILPVGGGAVKSIAQNAAKNTLKKSLIEGALGGAKYAGVYGALSSLNDNKDVKGPEYAKNIAKSTITGILGGGLLGGTLGGAGYAGGKFMSSAIKAYKKVFPKATEKEATEATTAFLRDEVGRFAKQETPKKEPMFYGEMRRSLGLKDEPTLPIGLQSKAKGGTKAILEAEEAKAARTKMKPGIIQTGDPEIDLQNALKSAESARGKQEAIYQTERSQKFGKFESIGKETTGEAGAYKQLGALKGEMTKVQFESIRKNLPQETVDALFNKGKDLPTVGDKITYINGLRDLMEGKLPQESRLEVLKKVLKPETIQAIMDKRSFFQKAVSEGLEIANLPRAIMATADLSAPLRQGIFLVGRPKQWLPAFRDMFKYAFSQKAYDGLEAELASRPNAQLYQDYDLALTKMDGGLNSREEAFMSNLAQKIPIFGKLARGSNRAYTGFLNKLRADTFDDMVKSANELDIKDPKFLSDVANFVNTATGRGKLGSFSGQAKALSNVFFSPRLMASRINLLNPVYYAKLHPTVRKEALKSLFTFATTGLTVLGLSKLAGADVGIDPRSSDFGKIKVGNTRYDIWGGFQQYIRLAAQLITGETVNSQTGEVSKIAGFGRNTDVYGAKTMKDLLSQFAESKANPVLSFALGLMTDKNAIGQPFDVGSQAVSMVIPLIIQDMYDIAKDRNSPFAALLGIPGIFGVGMQTYGKQVPTVTTNTKGNPKFKMIGITGLPEDISMGISNIISGNANAQPTTQEPQTPTGGLTITDILNKQQADADKTTFYKETMKSNATDQQKMDALSQAGFTQQDIKDQEMKALKSIDVKSKVSYIQEQLNQGATDLTTLYKNGILTTSVAQEMERQGVISNADELIKNMRATDVYYQNKAIRKLQKTKAKKISIKSILGKTKTFKYTPPKPVKTPKLNFKVPKVKVPKRPKIKSYKLPKIKLG